MATLGSFSVDIRAGTAKLQSDLGRGYHLFEQNAEQMKQTAQRAGVAIGAALAVGATAAGYAIKRAIDDADELSKLSQKIGITTESLSGLSHAAKLSDVSLQQLQGGIAQLVNRQGDAAQGMKEYARTFDALGIRVKNADGTLRDSMEVFGEVADVFQALPDGANKTKLAIELFGRAGADLIPLLNSGSEGLREMHDEAKRLGVVLDAETGKRAEEFNDNLTRFGVVIDGVALSVASELLPQLVSLSATLSSEEFREGFASIAQGAVTAAAKAAGLVAELGNIARFGGEEIAARLHGAEFGDLVRQSDEIERQRARIASMQAARARAGFDGENDAIRAARAELAQLEAAYADAVQAAERMASSQREGTETTEDQGRATGDLAERLRLLFKDQTSAADAAKRLAADQRAAAQAAAALARESARLIGIAEASYNPQVDQFTELSIALEAARLKFGETSVEALALQQALDDLAKRTLGQDMRQSMEDYDKWITRATEQQDKWREQTETDAARIRAALIMGIAQDVDLMFGSAFQDIASGADAWDAFGRSAVGALTGIIPKMGALVKETGSFMGAIKSKDFAPVLQALSVGIGSAIGGGGEGASMGASLGSAIGFALTAAGGGWGAPIGAILGGLVGGTFDEDPEFHIGGGSHIVRGREQQGRTALGAFVAVRTDGMGRDSDDEAFQAIQEFDAVLARLLPQEFHDGVAQALDGVFTRSELLETHLAARLEAALGVLPAEIGRFVEGWTLDLQGRVQALGDVFALFRLEEQGDLLSGTLEETLLLVDAFAMAGETIAQAYQRLATAATEYASVAAGIQEELLTGDLSDTQRKVLAIQRAELQRAEAMERAARAMGNLAPREEDLAAAREANRRAIARLLQELDLASRDLASDLYGRSIADIDAELQALRDAQTDVTSVTQSATSALQGFGEEMQRARDIASATLQFGGLRGQELADFALDALSRGEISLDQALQAGQDVFKSGADFQAFFDAAIAAFRSAPTPDRGGFTGRADRTAERTITAEEQALLDERARIEAEEDARRRLGLARDLAQNVADLAGIGGRDFADVMADLGFSGDQLAADLGIDASTLGDYLTSLQNSAVFDGTLAQTLEDLPENIARAMFDILRGEVPEGEIGIPSPPGSGDGPPPDQGPPGEIIEQSLPELKSIAGTSADSAELLGEIRDILRRVERIEAETATNTGHTARELRGVASATTRRELEHESRGGRG